MLESLYNKLGTLRTGMGRTEELGKGVNILFFELFKVTALLRYGLYTIKFTF